MSGIGDEKSKHKLKGTVKNMKSKVFYQEHEIEAIIKEIERRATEESGSDKEGFWAVLLELVQYMNATGMRVSEVWGLERENGSTMGHKISHVQIDRAMRKVLDELGIVKRSPVHCFRRAFAMRMVDCI